MPYAKNGAARPFWETRGEGSPVLLVMGATYGSRLWYPVLDALAEHHQVVSFDNRGIGQSPAVRSGSIEDMASDAAAVLDAAGLPSAHVYGVSLGGVVALQLALQAPERVRSLVLGCTGILTADKPRAPKWLNLLLRLPAGTRRRLLSRASTAGYGSAATPEAVARDLAVLAENRPTSTGMVQQQDALRAYSVAVADVAALPHPALVLHGTEDRTVPLAWGEELAGALDAPLLRFEGAGHNYLVAAADEANAAVLSFLAEQDAG